MCLLVHVSLCPPSDSGRRSERETEHYDGAKNAATGIQGGRRREEAKEAKEKKCSLTSHAVRGSPALLCFALVCSYNFGDI